METFSKTLIINYKINKTFIGDLYKTLSKNMWLEIYSLLILTKKLLLNNKCLSILRIQQTKYYLGIKTCTLPSTFQGLDSIFHVGSVQIR